MFRFLCGFTLTMLLAATALQADDTVQQRLTRAANAAAAGEHRQAVDILTQVIETQPDLAHAYYVRGRERFRLGEVEASVADFDKYVELSPAVEPRQWERGIAYYYVGKFKQGAAQFELYQTYHDNDVENSVWRYLCMVPTTGIAKARAVMLPIKDDPRNPMMQIFDLYRGKLKPADVLAETRRGDPPAAVLAGRQFYAHLYLGLYYEVAGDHAKARKYIDLAAAPELAKNDHINGYMWDVARIHQRKLIEARRSADAPTSPGKDKSDAPSQES